METVNVGGRSIKVSNPGKIFYPRDKITKRMLVQYYVKVSGYMLPHIKDRPLTMHRFPAGVDREGFYQKEAPHYFPEWIQRYRAVNKTGGDTTYPLCNDAESLAYIAEQGCVTLHVWLSRVDKPDQPDKIVFDLDPPGPEFQPARIAALLLKEFLDKLELSCYVMTTGSRGLHVVLPLKRQYSFEQTRRFAQRVGKILSKKYPDHITVEPRKEKRQGRLYLDTTRNSYGQTSVAPYSLRAKNQAPVATPIEWRELDNSSLNAQSYSIKNIFSKLRREGDPWRNIYNYRCGIKDASEKMLFL